MNLIVRHLSLTFLPVAAVIVLSVLPLSGCGPATGSDVEHRVTFDDWMPGKPHQSDRELPYSYELDPVKIFATSCAGCHGAEGRLGPAPPINDPIFLHIYSQDAMLAILAGGRNEGLMPSFVAKHRGGLTEQQRSILVKGIWARWGQASELPANIPPYHGQSPGNAAAGKALFTAACSRCHGDAGKGGSAGALNNRAFLDLVSDQLLRRIMITGRPDLGCPDFVEAGTESSLRRALTGTDIANVVALLGKWRSKKDKEMIDGP